MQDSAKLNSRKWTIFYVSWYLLEVLVGIIAIMLMSWSAFPIIEMLFYLSFIPIGISLMHNSKVQRWPLYCCYIWLDILVCLRTLSDYFFPITLTPLVMAILCLPPVAAVIAYWVIRQNQKDHQRKESEEPKVSTDGSTERIYIVPLESDELEERDWQNP